ncbi:MAG: hypothetical protein JWR44_1496 [Hymenobacter sp.]|nr:hypothetical protein [Hymenobacter sp.]
MKKLLPLLLLALGLGTADSATAQARPKAKAKAKVNVKRAFDHNSEASKGKTNRAQFRRENEIRPIIDLHPGKPEKFKTAKSNKNYKFSNGNGFKYKK